MKLTPQEVFDRLVNVDKIIVLMNGEIVEQGNHNELMKKNGFYANLYNSQFEKTNS